MTPTQRKTMQQALQEIESLENLTDQQERVFGRLCDKMRAALAEPQGEPVYFVATGEVWNGQETYTLHEGAPPPMCEFERVYTPPQPAIPPGYKLMPVEPTPEMVEQAAGAARVYMKATGGNCPAVIYRAMLNAAPEAPQPAHAKPASEEDMAVYRAIADNYRRDTAPQPAIPPGWAEAYAAFKGAFDTPLARRKDSSDFAQDARRLLREFNDAMLTAAEAPQPAKRVPLTPREIELIDGMIEVHLVHAERCDAIANRRIATKQKEWDMERVALLRKLRELNGGTK